MGLVKSILVMTTCLVIMIFGFWILKWHSPIIGAIMIGCSITAYVGTLFWINCHSNKTDIGKE